MSSAVLIFNILFACSITLIFLYRCGNYRRQHPITTGAVFIAWSFSVLFIFLLPLDISLVSERFCRVLAILCFFSTDLFRLPIENAIPVKDKQQQRQ